MNGRTIFRLYNQVKYIFILIGWIYKKNFYGLLNLGSTGVA